MTPTMTPLDSTAVLELQSLPAHVLAGLPLVTCVRVRLPDHERVVNLYVAGMPASDATEAELAFLPEEVTALAQGIEHGRTHARDLIAWCDLKASDPTFRVTPDMALAGVANSGGRPWSLGSALREIRAVIVEASIADNTVAASTPQIALSRAA